MVCFRIGSVNVNGAREEKKEHKSIYGTAKIKLMFYFDKKRTVTRPFGEKARPFESWHFSEWRSRLLLLCEALVS